MHLRGEVQDVAQRLRSADVLLRPSQTEGMPLAVLEAMASGVLLVASDIPGNASVVEDGVTGLLVPLDRPRELAGRLHWAATHPAERAALARAGRHAAAGHSWETAADATWAILAQAAGQGLALREGRPAV